MRRRLPLTLLMSDQPEERNGPPYLPNLRGPYSQRRVQTEGCPFKVNRGEGAGTPLSTPLQIRPTRDRCRPFDARLIRRDVRGRPRRSPGLDLVPLLLHPSCYHRCAISGVRGQVETVVIWTIKRKTEKIDKQVKTKLEFTSSTRENTGYEVQVLAHEVCKSDPFTLTLH